MVNREQQRITCYGCWRKIELCLCEHIEPFESQTEFILLMHPKEAKKQKLGTGRLSHALVKNSKIITGVNLDQEAELQEILNDPHRHVELMYLGLDPSFIDAPNIPAAWKSNIVEQNKKLTILILDATWPCAKKMMKLSTCLHQLPITSFKKPYTSKFVIKHQPNPHCLSTIETIYYSLLGLDQMGLEREIIQDAEKLMTIFQRMIDFQIRCAEDPNIPSSRGLKAKATPAKVRIREKKNRLFYWDVETSPAGTAPRRES